MTDEPKWHNWAFPLAFTVLITGFVTSIIAAFATGEWRWLILAGICYVLFAKA